MPEGKRKSRSQRRVYVRTPSSKSVLHYRARKPSKAVCGTCGAVLKGVPRETPAKLSKIPKSGRSPERPFGGKLCSACSRKIIVAIARSE